MDIKPILLNLHIAAGTAALLGAVSVVNFTTLPPLVTWLGPTALITPLIAWWSRRVWAGERGPV